MIVKANLGASVAARLLNRAKETGDDYQTLLNVGEPDKRIDTCL